MRMLVCRLLIKVVSLLFPSRDRAKFISDYFSEQVKLHERDKSLEKCVRPRVKWTEYHTVSYQRRFYTDCDDRNDFYSDECKSGLHD